MARRDDGACSRPSLGERQSVGGTIVVRLSSQDSSAKRFARALKSGAERLERLSPEGMGLHLDAAAMAQGNSELIAPQSGLAAGADPLALQRLRADIIGHDTVPSAPAILFEILQILADEDAGLRDLFGAIERDPGLTAKVLRTANSTFFGQARTVDTVERAVMVLGVAMVRSIAVSAAVFDRVGDRLSAGLVDRIWHHSLATATTARLLATRTKRGDRDDAFTAGLLHDAGRMLLMRRFPELHAEPEADTGIEAIERARIGVDHGVVGGWLFEAWNLPAAIVQAVTQHHAEHPAAGLPTLIFTANLMTRHPDGALLLAEASDLHAEAARNAAEEFGLTRESWSELAAGPGGARS
jgi:putative nucleotidyltransferase with HDIG domain